MSASFVRPSAKRGTELPLVLGEGPLDMNPMLVDVLGEPALQLAAVPRRRPFPSAAGIDRGHEGPDAERSDQFMMRFAVIGLVRENAIPIDPKGSIQQGGSEIGSVIAGSLADLSRQPQVAGRVTEDRQLGKSWSQERLGVGPFIAVVKADVPSLVTCSVERSFSLRVDQAAAMGSITDRIEESIESPFFKRRW